MVGSDKRGNMIVAKGRRAQSHSEGPAITSLKGGIRKNSDGCGGF